MSRYTKDDIFRMVEEEDVEFIRLQFTDIFGTLKNIAITSSQLEKALDNKCMFDGSSVEGFVRIEESDMYLYPDYDTFEIFPWRPQQGKVARLICDVHTPDGKPFEGDPRWILKKTIKEANEMGYRFDVGPECEFFLFHTDDNGLPTTLSHEKAGYFDLGPNDLGENIRRDMVLTLEDMGFEIEASHHEVAPAQHELAPIFSTTNIATDQNHLVMATMKKIAAKHDLECVLHEKPFAGVNGSGKHNNWSISTDEGENLIDPGKHPETNLQFQFFLAAVLAAVDNNAELLRLSASSAGNDHRLGANEAPPAIISAFLGEQLQSIVEQIIEKGEATESPKGKTYVSGASTLPTFTMDATDRNRTSPFAFTGNKFEFRMVGSTQSIAFPMMVLNTIVADQIKKMTDELEGADDFETACKALIRRELTAHQRIIFNGNGYSDEWVEEAAKRGLPNIKCMVDAVPYLAADKSVKIFESLGVMDKAELEARADVMLENYAKKINIEALTMIEMSNEEIIPAVMEYQAELAKGAAEIKALGIAPTVQVSLLNTISEKLTELKSATVALEELVAKAADYEGDTEAWAKYFHNTVFAAFDTVRKPADELEKDLPKTAWPFPTYEQLLFEQ